MASTVDLCEEHQGDQGKDTEAQYREYYSWR